MDPIDVLGGLAGEGKISAQVPDTPFNLSGEPPEVFAQYVKSFETAIDKLFEQGAVAWKVANPKPGTGKVLYTRQARNPQTKRLVGAYLWMTPLAVARYGQQLYELYVKGCQAREEKWTGSGRAEPFDTWQAKLLLETVPVAPDFAHPVPPQIRAASTPLRKTKTRTVYGKIGEDGFAERISMRKFNELKYTRGDGEQLLATLEALKVGPATLVGEENVRFFDNIVDTIIGQAGIRGVDWMLERGVKPTTGWYVMAINQIGGPKSLEVWDHLVSKGVDPKEAVDYGTLWHAILFNPPSEDATAYFDWLRKHGVDWNTPNPGGELPAARLISVLCQKLGQQDFYGATPAGNVISTMLMMMGKARQEMRTEKEQTLALENLLMDMIREGVDLTQKDKQGLSALDSLHPEQVFAERYLAKNGKNFFNCDLKVLARAPDAYGPKQLEFIRRLEMTTRLSLLDGPAAPNSKPRQARP